jgi:hypothetical protein
MSVRWPGPEASERLADRELQLTETRWAGDDEELAEGKIIIGMVPPTGPLLEPGSGVTL